MDAAPVELDHLREAAGPAASYAVLLVCGEPETLAALQRTVRLAGYRGLTTRHSWEALKLLEHEPVAMVIADQHLPRVTGTDLLKTVRDRWPGTLRVLLVGEVASELLGETALEEGAQRILPIPWPEWELRVALREAGEAYGRWQTLTQLQRQVQAQAVELERFHTEMDARIAQAVEHDLSERKLTEREWEAIGRVLAPVDLAAHSSDILTTLLIQVMRVFKAQGAALALHQPATGQSVIELGRGAWSQWETLHLPTAHDLPGYLTHSRQVCLVDDWRRDTRFAEAQLGDAVPAVAGLPLAAPGRVVGTLWLGRAAPFSDQEGRQLAAIGEVAAQFIDQALRRESLEDRLKLYLAQQATEQVAAAHQEFDAIITALLENMLEHLEVAAAAIWLSDPATQLLEAALQRGIPANLPAAAAERGEALVTQAAAERTVVHDTLPAVAGVELGFVSALAAPLLARTDLIGVVLIYHRAPLDLTPAWLEFLQTLTSQIAVILSNHQQLEGLQHANAELRLANEGLLEGWVNSLELRTPLSEGHLAYLVEITLRLARALKVPKADLAHIRRGVILHDIGKIVLPDNVLNSDKPFTEDDWKLMRKHPGFARDLIAPIAFLRPALDIPYCHHEAWDGSGYPRRLRSEEIPLAARVFSVIDVWDALRSDRPYRRGWPEGKTIEYIRSQAYKQFDPRVVQAFVKLWEEGELLLETALAHNRN